MIQEIPTKRYFMRPDMALNNAADFDVSLIGSKGGPLLVRVGIDKWLDADGGSLTERVTKIHLVSEAQGYDVRIIFAEFPGRSSRKIRVYEQQTVSELDTTICL